MDSTMYINCALMGLLGAFVSLLAVIKSYKDKARLSNVGNMMIDANTAKFSSWQVIKDDWYNVAGSLSAIAMGLISLQYVTVGSTHPLILLALFSTGGYFGNDLLFRFFSATNKRINAAIDYKTTQADAANNTLDAPTPAIKP